MAVNPTNMLGVLSGSTVSNPQVVELQFSGTPPSTIITPVAIGGSLEGSPNADLQATAFGAYVLNRVIEFQGDLYAYHALNIYKYDNVATWNIVHTPLNMDEAVGTAGFHILNRQGQDVLAMIFRRTTPSTFTARVVWTEDGSTWNDDGAFDVGQTTFSSVSHAGKTLIWKNRIVHMHYPGTTAVQARVGVSIPDPDWMGKGFQPSTSGTNSTFDAVEHLERCLMIGSPLSGGSDWQLFEFADPGNTVLLKLQDLTGFGFTWQNLNNNWPMLFVDENEDLYAVVCDNNPAGGLHALKLTSTGGPGTSFTELDVTTTIIPTELRTGGAQANRTSAIGCYVDTVANPTSPAIYFWVRTNSLDFASSYHLYQWAGPAATWDLVGLGIISDLYTLPHTKHGGSQYTFQGTNKIAAQIESFTTVSSTAANISFRVYGTGSDVSGRILHSGSATDPGGPPDTQATLIDPVSGGSMTRAGNQLNDITPDAGVTLYTCRWDFGTDGFNAGQSPRIVVDLF